MDTFETPKNSLKDSFNGIDFYVKKGERFEPTLPYQVIQMIMTKDFNDSSYLESVYYTSHSANSPSELLELFNQSESNEILLYKEGGRIVGQGTKSDLNFLTETIDHRASVEKPTPIMSHLDSLTELNFSIPSLTKYLNVFKGNGVLVREFFEEDSDDATYTFIKPGGIIQLLTEVDNSTLKSYWMIPKREDISLEEKQKSGDYVIGEIIFIDDNEEESEPFLFETRLSNLRSYLQFSPFDFGTGVLTNIVYPLRDPQFSIQGLKDVYPSLVKEIIKSNSQIKEVLHK